MDGVIIFADDNIFESTGFEYKLFKKLNEEKEYSILPINNLTSLEKTISSISTYRAVILDWNFKRSSGEAGVKIEDENPFDILEGNNIYSLIYIYSENDIDEKIKDKLRDLYKGKIQFQNKISDDNKVNSEFEKIIKEINKFNKTNQHLNTPFLWSKAINRSVQTIFRELEEADPNWIKEIYNTAKEDHSEPNTEVINVFQNLLNEQIIQESSILKSLEATAKLKDVPVTDREKSLSRLYNRIYYTRLVQDAPYSTGDIFKFSDNEFAILVTPECNIDSKKNLEFEFLKVNKDGFIQFLSTKKQYNKIDFSRTGKDKLSSLKKLFNNSEISIHLLPFFPFGDSIYNATAIIDFKFAFMIKSKADFESKRTDYKLNSPYIYQLRQRYLSYAGRVGVPSIPISLQEYNLK